MTGASRGIGFAIAEALVARAAWIALLALTGSAACAGASGEAAPPAPPPAAVATIRAATNRSVFVMAARQKPRIIESLAAAGIEVSTNLLEAGFTLRVTVGADQGREDCGSRNNVRYALRLENAAVLDLAEKGWTGICTPNVFDVLSGRLAGAFAIYDELQRAPREP